MTASGCPNGDVTSAAEIRAALERVALAPGFAGTRRGALLRYLVERALAGSAADTSEYAIALDVFGKPESFDPRTDSTIRSGMSRLRKSLAEYYSAEGAADAWRIEFPGRGYVPSFLPAAKLPAAGAPPTWRRWAWTAAAAVLLAGGAWAVWRAAAARVPVRSVVVLPFSNLTGDPRNDYIADGLTEGMTDALAQAATLRVVARTSAFQFRGKAMDIREIGRMVSADAAVEGSVRQTPEGLRVTVQVNRTRDGYHILSRNWDGRARDLGSAEAEMARPVLAALAGAAAARGRHVPTPEAYDLMLKARALRGTPTPAAFAGMITDLKRAIEIDPQYAEPYAVLAATYAAGAVNAMFDAETAARDARAAADRALELDADSAPAYAAKGYVDAFILNRWRAGEEELRSGMRRRPQSAAMHQWLGLLYMVQARFPESLVELRASERLDPLAPATGASVGLCLFMPRRYDEALEQWTKLAALHPDVLPIRELIGTAWQAKGEYGKAMAEYQALDGRIPTEICRIAHLLAVMGRKAEAEQRLAEYLKRPQVDPLTVAGIYGALGEPDQAFSWLDRAVERHSCWMLNVHPFLDPLRKDPRYRVLLARVGFGPPVP